MIGQGRMILPFWQKPSLSFLFLYLVFSRSLPMEERFAISMTRLAVAPRGFRRNRCSFLLLAVKQYAKSPRYKVDCMHGIARSFRSCGRFVLRHLIIEWRVATLILNKLAMRRREWNKVIRFCYITVSYCVLTLQLKKMYWNISLNLEYFTNKLKKRLF